MDCYSYKMLIEPASNVSVPFTVVITTRSSAPLSVTVKPPVWDLYNFIILIPSKPKRRLLNCKHMSARLEL